MKNDIQFRTHGIALLDEIHQKTNNIKNIDLRNEKLDNTALIITGIESEVENKNKSLIEYITYLSIRIKSKGATVIPFEGPLRFNKNINRIIIIGDFSNYNTCQYAIKCKSHLIKNCNYADVIVPYELFSNLSGKELKDRTISNVLLASMIDNSVKVVKNILL